MKKVCVCQFDKFALEHLIRPYQDMLGLGFDRVIKEVPMTYEALFDRLCKNDEWANLVLDRASKIGFEFSQWIQEKYPRRIINLIENRKL